VHAAEFPTPNLRASTPTNGPLQHVGRTRRVEHVGWAKPTFPRYANAYLYVRQASHGMGVWPDLDCAPEALGDLTMAPIEI